MHSSAYGQGSVFDYFDELRKILETTTHDVLFVDPYLDAEFVSRYLSHLSTQVHVRLLASKKLATLIPAVETFLKQQKIEIEVRSIEKIHDRYVIIDSRACYQSGASFKDGALNAPTTLTQLTDVFPAVLKTYEELWDRSTLRFSSRGNPIAA